jgi:glycosyltransferase involved in cell wall biosynthesis
VKVALVYATDFKNISPGGIQNYLYKLIESAPSALELTVLGVGEPPANFRHKFVSVLDQTKVEGKLNWSFSKALAKIQTSEFDFVVFQRAENQLFVRRHKNQRFIQLLHGGTLNAWRSRQSLFSALYPFLEFLAVVRSSSVLSVSPRKTLNYFVFRKKISRAPRIFDSSVFNADNLKAIRHSFAVIGRLSPEKNFDVAIQALSSACAETKREATLVVVGSGDQENSLKNLKVSESLKINFLGQKSSSEIAHLLKTQINTLLITSSFEGFPLVALEAVACEVGVIGINAPGVTDALMELQMPLCDSQDSLIKVLAKRMQNQLPIRFTNSPVDESKLFWDELLFL